MTIRTWTTVLCILAAVVVLLWGADYWLEHIAFGGPCGPESFGCRP